MSILRSTYAVVAPVTLALALALLAAPARAASADKLIEEAEELRTAGRIEEAAARFGAALAAAQKKGDLLSEERAAHGLDGLFGSSPEASGLAGRATVVGGAAVTDEERDLIALVLGQLDAKRNGAFVSAQVLARKLLLAASEAGDADHVRSAKNALVDSGKRAGKATATLATYADGLLALEDGKGEAAESAFRAALETAVEEGWTGVGVRASAELAGLRQAAGDAEGARAVLTRAAEAFDGEIGAGDAAAWARVLRARISEPDTELLNILRASLSGARPSTSGPVVSDGGYGKSKSTELGRAMKRFAKKKPLVTALAGPNGFALSRHFDPESEEVRRYRPSQQRIDYGGLVLATRGRTVALISATTENAGATGIRGVTKSVATMSGVGSVVRAEYLLARGEIWGVTKTGDVTIAAK